MGHPTSASSSALYPSTALYLPMALYPFYGPLSPLWYIPSAALCLLDGPLPPSTPLQPSTLPMGLHPLVALCPLYAKQAKGPLLFRKIVKCSSRSI
jgi:hypothetical protein